MPRKPRLHLPGGLYHVILRGNDRQAIFLADFDRRRWLRLLGDGIDRYRCRIHAYWWMTNQGFQCLRELSPKSWANPPPR